MSKLKNYLFYLFCIVPALVLGQAEKQKEANSPKFGQKYNVLFIAIDDLKPELGCYGQPIHSPNIDRLAVNGLVFNNAYCQEALCSPSRTSMLTGLRPDATQVYGLEEHFRNTVPDVITLPQHFKNHGYRTVSVGKIFHSGLDDSLSWHFSEHGHYEPWVSEENLRLVKESPEKRAELMK